MLLAPHHRPRRSLLPEQFGRGFVGFLFTFVFCSQLAAISLDATSEDTLVATESHSTSVTDAASASSLSVTGGVLHRRVVTAASEPANAPHDSTPPSEKPDPEVVAWQAFIGSCTAWIDQLEQVQRNCETIWGLAHTGQPRHIEVARLQTVTLDLLVALGTRPQPTHRLDRQWSTHLQEVFGFLRARQWQVTSWLRTRPEQIDRGLLPMINQGRALLTRLRNDLNALVGPPAKTAGR